MWDPYFYHSAKPHNAQHVTRNKKGVVALGNRPYNRCLVLPLTPPQETTALVITFATELSCALNISLPLFDGGRILGVRHLTANNANFEFLPVPDDRKSFSHVLWKHLSQPQKIFFTGSHNSSFLKSIYLDFSKYNEKSQ